MKKLGRGTAALGLLAAFVTAAAAKSDLRCTMVDENGKPLAKQQMVLSTTVGGKDKEWKRKTDEAGLVEFKGLDEGSYQVRGEIQGYVAGKSEPIPLPGNESQPCHLTIPSTTAANALLQEVLQLVRQKQHVEAQEKGKKVVQWLPEEAGAHYVLAVAYASAGQEEGAVTAIQKAAKLNGEKYQGMIPTVHVMALSAQADIALAKKDFEGAMKKYEAMQAISPKEPTVYYNMAMAYARVERYEEALKTMDKAIALNPEDVEMQRMKLRLQDLYLKAMDKKLELDK